MTMESWKAEFYTEDAADFTEKSDEECLKHCIKKWTGALPENTQRHEVTYHEYEIKPLSEDIRRFSFTGISCALCQKYSDSSPDVDDLDCFSDNEDEYCPIVKITEDTCNDVYTDCWKNPQEMLKLLAIIQEKL